ncbi:MAG: D-aminopeptidase [Myxococcales bacterium]|nr:D-aminopeptidase [Myxococcales bacterium]
MTRKRLRELGVPIGRYPTGPHNAITDVGGVRVGHSTIISGEGKLDRGKGPVRTGVSCVMPHVDVYRERLIGGTFVLNGAGEVAGLTQVSEWGLIETPILLTNTLSVGKVADATVKWMSKKYPGLGSEEDVVIPVVGECDDSFLNDAVGRHIRSDNVYKAIETATSGPVAEGSVGAGTGMMTCDFKAGIGTSSRTIRADVGVYTVGVLVLTNFGVMTNLRIDGVAVGEILAPEYSALGKRISNYGSIIAIVGTDAPLLSSQLARLSKRAALGIGRCGSYAAHGSGEIILAFSTANKVPRVAEGMTTKIEILLDRAIGPLYESVIEATEEAIVNALCMADDMTGQGGNFAPALPLDRVVEIMKKYRPTPHAAPV